VHRVSAAYGQNLYLGAESRDALYDLLLMAEWTIQRLLNWVTEHFTAKGVDSPRLSAELLLSDVLELKRIELYTNFDRAVGSEELGRLRELVRRAAEHEPVAYLVGRCEFYSLELDVTRGCMIPRPETEVLVERAIEFLRGRSGRQFVCDLCTGCGCMAVAIAKNLPETRIIATDISSEALSAAAANVEKHKLERQIELLCGDLFDPILPQLDVSGFDLIVCNPPYVSAGEYERLARHVKEFEPALALLAGEDGLDVYRRIAREAERFLKADAALMLEVGYAQGPAVKGLLEEAGVFGEVRIEKDFGDNDRVVTAVKREK